MSGKHPTWYAFVRWLVKDVYFRTHGGIQSIGEENIPPTGGVIIAPIHISHLDPPAVASGMNRHLRFMAKEELFHNKLFGALITSVGSFPVRRGETDTQSIRTAISLLEAGEAVLIFPEGSRGDGESIQELSRGVAMLAKKTNVPVVPVGIVGTNIVMPRGKTKGRKHRTIVAYGEPFTYLQMAAGSTEKENRDRFTQALQQRIVRLCAENGLPLKIEMKHSS